MLRSIFLSVALIAAPLTAQSTEPIAHTAADLQQREAKLIETAKASPTGLAIGRLENYGNDYTLLVVRTHTGDAERHQFWADQIYVNRGDLILVYGGTMLQERPNSGPPSPAKLSAPASKAEKRSPSTRETSSTFPPASPTGLKSPPEPPLPISYSKRKIKTNNRSHPRSIRPGSGRYT